MPRPRLEDPAPARRDPRPSLQEYEEALIINEHQLQVECRNQPELFYHVARDCGRASTELERAKQTLKRVTAEVALQVRILAEEQEARMTEGKCVELTTTDVRVREATEVMELARSRKEDLDALKESYMQRKDMLRELVNLHLANYYADPIRGAATSVLRDEAVQGVRAARRREQERNRR